MSDDFQLEQELAELRPRAASPELRARVASRLVNWRADRWRRVVWSVAGIASGIALVALVMVGMPRRRSEPEAEGMVRLSNSSIPPRFDALAPTVWNYRRATIDPGVELDQLLDQHRLSEQPLNRREPRPASPEPLSVSSFHQQSRRGEL